jgi:hypothetical protein
MEGHQQVLPLPSDLVDLGGHQGGLVYEVPAYDNSCEMKFGG